MNMATSQDLASAQPALFQKQGRSPFKVGTICMHELNNRARVYIVATMALGALLIWRQYLNLELQHLVALAVACILASLAQLFKTEGATSTSSFNMSWVVYGATFALLGTPETVIVIVVAHVVEWIWRRYRWYLPAFNIASFAIVASIAGIAYSHVAPLDSTFGLYVVLIMFVGNLLFTFTNHLMVGSAILLARGQSFNESGLLSRTTFFMDLGLLSLGTSAAIISLVTPYAIVFVSVAIYLLYTVLKIPALQRQSRLDPKTGLYNATFFDGALEREFERAKRLNRPLCVVMADLDRLRPINNTYGHLAGDAVLKKIAQILKGMTRQSDIVARFGGEEFAILMPNTPLRLAYIEVEAMRKAIEAADFWVETNPTPIKTTMSFGIACRTGGSEHARILVHQADLAMYGAKRNGRNRTSLYEDGFPLAYGPAQEESGKETEAWTHPAPSNLVNEWAERWRLSSIRYKANL